MILSDKKIFSSSWNQNSFTHLTRKFNRMILFLSIFGCQCSDDIIRNLSHLFHKSAQVPLGLFSISGKLYPQWSKDIYFHYVLHLKIPWKNVFFSENFSKSLMKDPNWLGLGHLLGCEPIMVAKSWIIYPPF